MIGRITIALVVALCAGCSRIDTTTFRASGWNLGDPQKRVIFVVDGKNVGPVVEPGDTEGPFDVRVVYDKPLYYGVGPSQVRTAKVVLGARNADTGVIFVRGECNLAEDSVNNFIYEIIRGTEWVFCRR